MKTSQTARRAFLKTAVVGLGSLCLTRASWAGARKEKRGPFKFSSLKARIRGRGLDKPELPPLSYPMAGLAPFVSERTMEYHYGKHHRAYVMKTQNLLMESSLPKDDLVEVILSTAQDPERVTLFQNAAQSWNHSFYWLSMKPGGGGPPRGPIMEAIRSRFGSYENCEARFLEMGMSCFGSGWLWLVQQEREIHFMTTANADNPMTQGYRPLMVVDLWEHAYYLDHQNRRKNYLQSVWAHLIDWDFANANLA